MKINSNLGYEPVTYSELTQDEAFWQGCKSCVNYDILTAKGRKNCMCTAMLFDPVEKAKQSEDKMKKITHKATLLERIENALKRSTKLIVAHNKFYLFERQKPLTFRLSPFTSKIQMKKKVVLAYSGGLDTSFCCIYLTRDLGMKCTR
jgi:predicted PP-loop superfamily ATPase